MFFPQEVKISHKPHINRGNEWCFLGDRCGVSQRLTFHRMGQSRLSNWLLSKCLDKYLFMHHYSVTQYLSGPVGCRSRDYLICDLRRRNLKSRGGGN